MARMIPPYVHESSPPGERLLFDRLKNDPGTEGWVVLHSLGVASHIKRVEGEIDFVLLVPDEGVLCLEVKSGKVSRDEGVWRYGVGPFAITSKVGPFRQASEGMYSLRKFVLQNDTTLSSIMFFSGVVFTLIDFDETSPEWHPWQFVDRSRLSRNRPSQCFVGMLRSARKHFQNIPSAKWFNERKSCPNQDQIDKLVELFRPDFEYFVSPRLEVNEAEKIISRFTQEQFEALDVLEENSRILFKGPAGSGKTFLALEAARRTLGANKRTLLVCYNTLLGKWLQEQTSELTSTYNGLLKVGTFHQFMLGISGISKKDDATSDFWSKELPTVVTERILEGIVTIPQFDFLILDEVPDLVSEEYLDVLDLLLAGGLAGGDWSFFGDFERQAIYARHQRDGVDTILPLIERRCPNFFKYPLRNNCRNSRSIAIGIETTCGLQPGYSRVLNSDGLDHEIEVYFYKNQKDQIKQLKSVLEELNDIYDANEIVVLSPRKDDSSCSSVLNGLSGGLKLSALREHFKDSDLIGFASIHSFKGLEASAVIITDMEKIRGEKALELLYVGMSRARTRLTVFFNERCREDYLDAVRKGLFKRRSAGGS